MSNIILASQSPRRKQLLEWAELDFDIVVEPTDESFPSNMAAEEVPIFIAAKKSDAVQHKLPGKIIIAADTIVVLGEEIINKPANRDEAIDMLQKLSGQQHRVITGVVINGNGKSISFSDITYVDFHPLTTEQIEFYVDQYKPYDKAGAYAIQEWIGVIGIKSINGDFYNVMGLPVSRVMKALEEFSHS
jgi:septum formation protein